MMVVETQRFGPIEAQESKVIKFPQGLPGFEELQEFIILEMEESRPIFWLQSAQVSYICLPVLIPFEFVEDYYIEIGDNELADLDIVDKLDLLILNVLVIPEDITQMTANLAAPIIINTRAGKGKQIIVDAKELSIRHPVYEAIMKKLKGGESDAGAVTQEG